MAEGKKHLPQVANLATVRDLLTKCKDQLAMALPRHVTPDRLIRVALTAMQRNPMLLECTQASLLGSIFECAQLGLLPDGVLGHAYVIPYRNRKAGTVEAQFQIGYRGLIDLACRGGQVRWITGHVVYENDEFVFEFGADPKLMHKPTEGDRGEVKGAYAVAYFREGGSAWDYMNRGEIEAIRRSSRAGDDGPWVTHWEPMAVKTVIRRLAKYLPLNTECIRAIALDEMADAGVPQNLGTDMREALNLEPAAAMAAERRQAMTNGDEQQEEKPPDDDAEGVELLWETWKAKWLANLGDVKAPKGWEAKAASSLRDYRAKHPEQDAMQIMLLIQEGQVQVGQVQVGGDR